MKKSDIAKLGLTAIGTLVPVPGLSLLLNKRVRRAVVRVAGFAMLGAGVLVIAPAALYLMRKTPGESGQTN
jgi:hypothetical protein